MKGTLDDGLPSASSTQAERLLEHDAEGLGVDRLQLADRRHQLLAERVARAPSA